MSLTSEKMMTQGKLCIAILLCTGLLNGCGFKLKKAPVLPQDLLQLTISSHDLKSALFRQLKKQLSHAKLGSQGRSESQDPQINGPQLFLHKDKFDRRTLSLFQNGQVAEYELTYHVSYQLVRPGQEVIEQKFELNRTYQDDPNNALAKARELDLILAELRLQASHRIIRELSAL